MEWALELGVLHETLLDETHDAVQTLFLSKFDAAAADAELQSVLLLLCSVLCSALIVSCMQKEPIWIQQLISFDKLDASSSALPLPPSATPAPFSRLHQSVLSPALYSSSARRWRSTFSSLCAAHPHSVQSWCFSL